MNFSKSPNTVKVHLACMEHLQCFMLSQPIGRYIRLISSDPSSTEMSIQEVHVYGELSEEIDTDGDGLYSEDCNHGFQCRLLPTATSIL